jgi:hypothetical protein
MPLPERQRPRVLVACTPEGFPVLHGILGDAVELVPVHSEEEALRRLARDARVALLLCSMRFDDSRMLDLVRDAVVGHPRIPCVCCRVNPGSHLSDESLHGAFVAAGFLGAQEFIDLPELEAALGAPRARERFRAIVLGHLEPDRVCGGESRAA